MKRLIVRADDLGYSEAVNYGIAKTVNQGLVNTIGIMTNMPSSKDGLGLLKKADLCLGQHTNICVGHPCISPEKIPSLVDESGEFKTSKEYRAAYADGRDFVNVDEAVLEIEAQYKQFLKLTGQTPDYFEAHAVMSYNFLQALEIVAKMYNLRYATFPVPGEKFFFDHQEINMLPPNDPEPDYDPYKRLKNAVKNADDKLPNVFVNHPGYMDLYLLTHSSLTVSRTKEVEMLTDKEMLNWIKEQDIRQISYCDL